jgi:hypothetical protein
VVREVHADARKIHDDFDSEAGEQGRITNTRELEEL